MPTLQPFAKPQAPQADAPKDGLTVLLQMEADIRALISEEELGFHSVNATRPLLNQRQAFVFKSRNGGKSFRLFGASSLHTIDRTSPYVHALEKAVQQATSKHKAQEVFIFSLPNAKGTETFPFRHALWAPMHMPNGSCFGGLLYCNDKAWSPSNITIADRLRRMYGYAWTAVVGRKRLQTKPLWRRFIPLFVIGGFILACFIRVPQTVVAPTEIVAKDPTIIAAPIRGVVREVLVQNEQEVRQGQKLVEYEDAALLSELQVSIRKVELARAQLQRAEQLSFTDPNAKGEIAILQSELALREAEQSFVQYQLDQSSLTAPQDGLALVKNPDVWKGRSVNIGERILRIANPRAVELRIDLALNDALALKEGADIRVFLDVDPLNTYSATLISSDFNATPTDTGELVYKTTATFDETHDLNELRIGLRGAAQIYGDNVSLGFLVFRRPISALRQYLGF